VIERVKLIVTESFRSLGANLSTTLAATVTVLIGMFLLGLFIAFGTWVVSWSNHVKRELVVHVYYCTSDTCAKEATTGQMNRVANIASSSSLVKRIVPVSKEEALALMRKKHPEEVDSLPSNPFPNALTVIPKRGEDVEKVAALFQASPTLGIDKVDYGKQTTHRVLKLAHVIEIFFIIAVALLLAASTLLIANTIRLSIFSRRREIEVMKLVGATNWFVRGPFMLEGVICGLLGSITAVVLLLVGKEVLLPAILGHIQDSKDVHALAFELQALSIIGAGLLLGAAGSGLTLHRFLRV
jgi:cell division transport system permease protein